MANHTRKIVFTAIMVALTTILTMISIALPGGYYNFGDIAIFISAIAFGPVAGAITGGLGGAIGDLILGYIPYAPFTLLIKAVEGLVVGLIAKAVTSFCQKSSTSKANLIESIFNLLACLLGGLIMALGYFFSESLILSDGGFAGGIVNLPWNILQGTISSVLTIVLLYALRLKSVLTKIYTKNQQR